MSDLGPGEVYERFAADLDAARTNLESSRGDLEVAEEDAQSVMKEVKDAQGTVSQNEANLRQVLGLTMRAIEASGQPNDDDTLAAVMRAWGSSDDSIERYFSHIDNLREEGVPWAVIDTSMAIGPDGIVELTYGRTAHDDPVSIERPDIGKRLFSVDLSGATGFVTDTYPEFNARRIFGRPEGDETVDTIKLNALRPFTTLKFVSSPEDIDAVESRIAEAAGGEHEQVAINAIGVPAVVAYGTDAVLDISKRIARYNPSYGVLIRRCLDGAGVEVSSIPELADLELSEPLKEGLRSDFSVALQEFLRKGPDSSVFRHYAQLAFLGPLQEEIGYSPSSVLDEAQLAVRAAYSHSREEVVTDGFASVESGLGRLLNELKDYGIDAASDPESITAAIYEIKRRTIAGEIVQTPARKFITRRRLTNELTAL